MDILQLVDRLEELFNQSRPIPLTNNVIVDEDKMLDLIDQMRVAIPDEVKKAQKLIAERDRTMAQATEEAKRTLQLAQEKSQGMVQRDAIVASAESRANEILQQAQLDAEATRDEADNYVIESLTNLEMELERVLNQVRNGIRAVIQQQDEKKAAKQAQAPEQTPTE
ncbi:MAG: ATPase [Chloroflexi bacterium]|nr:ATPase [Chloroflexota bacterium]